VKLNPVMISKALLIFLVVMDLLTAVPGCGWGRRSAPAWIEGASAEYPVERYLTGVGQAESKPAATERAYGAVAKIFKYRSRECWLMPSPHGSYKGRFNNGAF